MQSPSSLFLNVGIREGVWDRMHRIKDIAWPAEVLKLVSPWKMRRNLVSSKAPAGILGLPQNHECVDRALQVIGSWGKEHGELGLKWYLECEARAGCRSYTGQEAKVHPTIGTASPATIVLELSVTDPIRIYTLLYVEHMTDIWNFGLLLSNILLIALLQQTMGLEFWLGCPNLTMMTFLVRLEFLVLELPDLPALNLIGLSGTGRQVDLKDWHCAHHIQQVRC